MVQLDFAKQEIKVKIVYYGPGLSGKTTNLEVLHKKAPNERKSKLLSVATKDDRTLFFDFMSLDLGKVGGMTTKFQIYTVPGQVYYNSTRKLVLMAVDGVVFVADSQKHKLEENKESLANLEDNLQEYNLKLSDMPFVMQWNKRDMKDILSVEELNAELNTLGVEHFEAQAVLGVGVYETLKGLAKQVISNLQRKWEAYKPGGEGKKGS